MQKLSVVHTKVWDASSSAVTATANSPSTFNGGGYGSMIAYLNVTTATGTTPSMTVKFQDSPDGGTTWYDVTSGAFSAATAAGSQRLVVPNIGSKLRAVATVSGTTPSFNFTLDVVGTN